MYVLDKINQILEFGRALSWAAVYNPPQTWRREDSWTELLQSSWFGSKSCANFPRQVHPDPRSVLSTAFNCTTITVEGAQSISTAPCPFSDQQIQCFRRQIGSHSTHVGFLQAGSSIAFAPIIPWSENHVQASFLRLQSLSISSPREPKPVPDISSTS